MLVHPKFFDLATPLDESVIKRYTNVLSAYLLTYLLTYFFRLANMSSAESSHLLVESVVNKAVAPAICVFGIIGNLLNLVVLTRKRLQCSMDRMRRSMGRIARPPLHGSHGEVCARGSRGAGSV